MPRDGSNIYHRPPGTDGIPNYTIESAKYNANVADVEQDLNTPRPIVAGGTGANNAHDALINLHGEESGQVVDNYDSFPFVAGSFRSLPGATAAPNSTDYFAGICYAFDNASMTLEARAVTPSPNNKLWVRQKSTTWGAWVLQSGSVADLDAAYVNIGGDTMTGGLIAPNLQSNGGVFTGAAAPKTGTYYFGSDTTKFLLCNGTDYGFGPGNLQVSSISTTGNVSATGIITAGPAVTGAILAGDMAASRTTTTGALFFGTAAAKIIYMDGTSFNLIGGGVVINAGSLSADAGTIQGTGYKVRAGISGAYGANFFNINHGTGQQLWIDTTNAGTFAYTSDYRIKKDVIDLPGMWDTVKALRPIKYTQAQFSPPSHVDYVKEQVAKAAQTKEGEAPPLIPGHLYEADDIERWGFIAHELQEVMTPSAASGVKDAPDTIQSPNPFTLIAALTKALQEAMTRIEALEGGAARR